MSIMSKEGRLFVGRKSELNSLEDLLRQGGASLVVIRGRRRIGKSRLAEEFGRGKRFLPFSGLAPTKGIKAQDERDAFARQLAEHFQLPPLTFQDWADAFAHLARLLDHQPTVILLDEISWMGAKDPTFISKLKNWWDLTLQKKANVVLILCGSISTWIDKNIIHSTAFFGRISLYIELGELSLPESREFLSRRGVRGSELDIFKILSVVGGIPWYLEQIYSDQTADDNLKRLCFEKNGVLVHEFDRIFHDLFSSRNEVYKSIIQMLVEGMRDLKEIRKGLSYTHSGSLSEHLKALEISGFVSKHYQWSLKTGKLGRKSLYRLSDNYIHFYLKYIEPNLPKIVMNAFADSPLSSLPGWEAMMGLQLENLLLKNRTLILKALRVYPQDVQADNPYIQSSTLRQKGCQIDYLIQTQARSLFVCEIKMRKKGLGTEVVDEMQEKINRFSVPKGFGICPVLLHLGPVSDALLSSRYFYKIIDIADFLKSPS